MKLKNLLIATLGVATLALAFSSCGKDENAVSPVITFTKSTDTKATVKVYDGQPLNVYVKLGSAKTTLKSLQAVVTYKNNGTAGTDPAVDIKTQKVTDQENTVFGVFNKSIPAAYTDVKIAFTAKDSNGKTGIVEIDYKPATTANDGGTPPAATKKFSETRTGAIDNLSGAGFGSFNLKTGKALKIADSKKEDRYIINLTKGKDKDFNAAWTSGDGAKASVPGAVGNGCKFYRSTQFPYASLTADQVAMGVKHAASKMSETVEGIKEGDVIFAQKGDEIYLMKITKVDKTKNFTRASVGYIAFEYKQVLDI